VFTILEFLTNFYWIILPQTLLQSLWHTDWRAAGQRRGCLGLLWEALLSLSLLNAVTFYVPLYGGWSGREIQKLLHYYGIPIWGWGYAEHQFFFHVRKREAGFAEEILYEAGVPLC
jgi:hypothetical protein